MKIFFNILLILFIPFLSFSYSFEKKISNIKNTPIKYTTVKTLDDSTNCKNTYSVEIYSHIDEKTANEIKNRLLVKKGICTATYIDLTKSFEISTIEIINEKTIRELVLHICKSLNIREKDNNLNQQK